ncbi:amidohydrolase family protein [Maricaulis salignorans]|uniref:Amidohydrolase family protein n=1 Tax=Maricaulis salignorans TaxID=144026 RepID=A0A1G9PHY6_9PROT|nr:amidohydrolase family protein [Maricaulis salignorans]SDL98153.1 Amidohydrolase family protein [Maricaulis salignorans]
MPYTKILLVLALGLAACTPPSDELLIENVAIVSAHLDAPSAPQNVLVRDGVIVAVSAEPITAGRQAQRIDASGRFLTPGLMDSHHHVAFVPGMGAMGVTPASDHPALVEAYMAQQPRSLLYYGVTQILDPAPLLAWRDFEAAPLAPDLLRCGEIPNALEGYPLNQRDDSDALALYPYRIEGEATPEAVIARIAADGGVCVKLYLEDGFGAETGWPLFDADMLARIRDAAHAQGLPVIAHANAIDMYQIALDARLDILGHGLWNWQWPEGEPPVGETLNRLVEQGTGYMPTHGVMAGLGGQLRPDALADPQLANVVPAALLDWYRTAGGQWFADELAADFPPDMPREEMADIFGFGVGRAQRATAYLHAQGHPLLLASDCPGSPTFVNQPGLCTWREILSLNEAGVSLQAILEAGTINPARQFGLEADYGTVEAGKVANLLILTANPLEDVTAWDRIETIILRGEAISRHSLAAP